MRDWKTINGRRKRYQRTRGTGTCVLYAFFKYVNERMSSFKFGDYERKEK